MATVTLTYWNQESLTAKIQLSGKEEEYVVKVPGSIPDQAGVVAYLLAQAGIILHNPDLSAEVGTVIGEVS